MCGILGVYSKSGFDIESRQNLAQALKTLTHRGPDHTGEKYFSLARGINDSVQKQEQLYFGHTRLSIIDLSEAANQPFESPDGRYHLIYNGELYNYLELKEELVSLGYQFQTKTDSEVLLNAYIEWGASILPRFVGMFAFAIYDADENKLFLARDPFGIKPLYFYQDHGKIAFASEIGALLNIADVDSSFDAKSIYQYLEYGAVDQNDNSFYSEIKKFPAGNFAEICLQSGSSIDFSTYWKVNTKNCLPVSFDQAAIKLRNLFLESVELHLRSDVAVGSALSGGLDSSSIVCAIRHIRPKMELHTFTYEAEDESLSESHWAKQVSDHVNAVSHVVKVDRRELIGDLDVLIQNQGEPFASTSIYAQNRVFRLAAENGIKVMLDGQGADELFAGYSGYAGARLASLLRAGDVSLALRFLASLRQWPNLSAQQAIKGACGILLPDLIRRIIRITRRNSVEHSWLDPGWFETRGANTLEREPRVTYSRWYLRSLLVDTLTRTSVPALLRYEDRNSMAYSIESRVPFLTIPIAEFVYSLPENYLIDNNGRTKALLRESMRGIVPDKLLDRKDKKGFETPESAWIVAMGAYCKKVLSSNNSAAMLKLERIEEDVQRMLDGREKVDSRFWRYINFVRWLELAQAGKTD